MIIMIKTMTMIKTQIMRWFSNRVQVFIGDKSFYNGSVHHAVVLGCNYCVSYCVEIDLILFTDIVWIGFGIVDHVPLYHKVCFDGAVDHDDNFFVIASAVNTFYFWVFLLFTNFEINVEKVLWVKNSILEVVVMDGFFVVKNEIFVVENKFISI